MFAVTAVLDSSFCALSFLLACAPNSRPCVPFLSFLPPSLPSCIFPLTLFFSPHSVLSPLQSTSLSCPVLSPPLRVSPRARAPLQSVKSSRREQHTLYHHAKQSAAVARAKATRRPNKQQREQSRITHSGRLDHSNKPNNASTQPLSTQPRMSKRTKNAPPSLAGRRRWQGQAHRTHPAPGAHQLNGAPPVSKQQRHTLSCPPPTPCLFSLVFPPPLLLLFSSPSPLFSRSSLLSLPCGLGHAWAGLDPPSRRASDR